MAEYFNSTQNIIINRIENGDLYVQCSLLGTLQEASAWISTDVHTFQITGAGAEVYRSFDEKPGYADYPELIGMVAYLNTSKQLKTVIGPDHQVTRQLLSVCFRSIIQIEPFILSERGYSDLGAYYAKWNIINDNSCFAYSQPGNVVPIWPYEKRRYNLFNGSHIIHLFKEKNHKIVSGTFMDTFHEITVHLKLDNTNGILAASADYIRVPHQPCSKSSMLMRNLIGQSFNDISKKEIAALIGGPEGCFHLVDIISDACRLNQASSHYT